MAKHFCKTNSHPKQAEALDVTAVLTHAQPHVALDFVQIKLIPKKTRPFEKKKTPSQQ